MHRDSAKRSDPPPARATPPGRPHRDGTTAIATPELRPAATGVPPSSPADGRSFKSGIAAVLATFADEASVREAMSTTDCDELVVLSIG
jgi:ApbE superfamily uncharacterized protein (UPF0280 family)